jgi:hypothetical protein
MNSTAHTVVLKSGGETVIFEMTQSSKKVAYRNSRG